MTFWSAVKVSWQAFKTRRKMNRQFGKREDPFSYATTPYEAARLVAMDEALGSGPLGPVLEVGCAEGHFTEKLTGRSSRVLAIDISTVALARARKRAPQAVFIEADLMSWEPGSEAPFDAVIVADVLYYLDRAGVRAEFSELFPRIASWLKPGGRLLLAHGFAGDKELAHRRSFRERFESAGLRLVSETIPGADRGGVRCLLSTLEKI
jgi:trans-aconitate methyltransferase